MACTEELSQNWFQNRRAKDKQIQKTLEFERVREEAARSGSPSDHAIDHARSATPPRSASVTARPLAEPNNGMFGSQDRQYAPETSTEQPLLLPASLDATTSANSSINEDIAGLMDRFYSLMGQWYFWRATQLPSRLQPVQGHGGSGKNTESTGDGARTTASTKLGKDHTRGSVSNPPLAPERRFPRDEEDDSDEERQHKKPKLKDSDTETQRLACPYFKRNPTLYRHWRSCPGPGWGTVHRVKYDPFFMLSRPKVMLTTRTGNIYTGATCYLPAVHAATKHLSQKRRSSNISSPRNPAPFGTNLGSTASIQLPTSSSGAGNFSRGKKLR